MLSPRNRCFKKPLSELLGSSTKSSNSPTNQTVSFHLWQSPVNLILPHGTQLLWNLTRETRVSIFSQYPCLSFIGPVISEFWCQLWMLCAILHKEYRKFHDLLIYCLSHLHFLFMLPSFLKPTHLPVAESVESRRWFHGADHEWFPRAVKLTEGSWAQSDFHCALVVQMNLLQP